MPRLDFTRKQRQQIADRAAYKCELCGLPAVPGEADHINPVEVSQDSEITNGQWLCGPCHKDKTARDIRAIRKSDRVRDRHTGVMPKSKRGFRSWRRFDGSIVRRDER